MGALELEQICVFRDPEPSESTNDDESDSRTGQNTS